MPPLSPPITSRSNARVKALRASLSGEARRGGDLLGLEGEHLVKEATLAGLVFETVYVREGSEGILDHRGWPEQIRAESRVVLSREVFDSAVSTATPQGIAATWVIRDPAGRSPRPAAGMILENLQDPGNLGTLIRSAAAFNMGEVLVTPETVNPWNPKVVRAAAGAAFRVPVRRLPLEEAVAQLRSAGVRVFAAVSSLESDPGYGSPVLAAPHGVLTGRVVNAGAPPSEPPGYAASFSVDTDFVEPCAIMIGNEGAGLSVEARRLADEQVLIPCSMESLNAAVAGSVLMYEVMRQRTLRVWARQQGLRP